MKSIHIAGGDRRQIFLCEMLQEKGYSVSLSGFEKLSVQSSFERADIVFLPVPYAAPEGYIKAPFSNAKTKLEDVLNSYKNSFFVLGRCDEKAKKLLGGRCFDLLADESFLIENAALTAEGAVLSYQNYKKKSLINAKCVVVGYGRIGRLLCGMLKAYTADVTATARKERDLALIRAAHVRAEHTENMKKKVRNADVIFNTVPHHVFGKEELRAVKKSAVLIELASPPYGCDLELAQRLGIDLKIEPGIPGRYFPKAAAKAILRVFEREEKANGYEG